MAAIRRTYGLRAMTTSATTEPLTRFGIPIDPQLRILAIGQFANRFGTGAVMTTAALYFTRHVGFSAAEVALAMSVSAVVGLLVQVLPGHLGDTRGPRRVLTLLMTGAALTAALPVLARSPWASFALALGLLAAFERGAGAVNQGVIAQLATGGRGVQFKAYLRAVTNVGIALGSMLGGLALVVDQTWAYVGAFVLNAALTGVAAWNTTRLPPLPGVHARRRRASAGGAARHAVRRRDGADRRLQPALRRHGARHRALHLRAHRGADRDGGGAAAGQHRRCSAVPGAPLASCRLGHDRGARARARRGAHRRRVRARRLRRLGHHRGRDRVPGCRGARARRRRDDRLGRAVGAPDGAAPHERQGQYQGFAGLGFGVSSVLGPPIVIVLAVHQGAVGWFALAGLILVTSLATVPVARWALESRARYGVTTHSG